MLQQAYDFFDESNAIYDLLSDNGSLFLHLGIQVNSLARTLCEEIFGKEILPKNFSIVVN